MLNNQYVRLGLYVLGGLVLLFVLIQTLPFDFNEAGNRVVITYSDGTQKVQRTSGLYYSGFFSRQQTWPNQMTVSFMDSSRTEELHDNTLGVGWIKVRFSDAVTGDAKGIVQLELPLDDERMLKIHNNHKTPEGLLTRRVYPYVRECLNNSGQLMNSETYYGGGKSSFSQDYLDQLQNGQYLLSIQTSTVYDTIEKQEKSVIRSVKQTNSAGQLLRRKSSLSEYGMLISDAQIVDIDPMYSVKAMLERKIASAQQAAISKQQRITAEQEALTARARGEQELIATEYEQKKAQTASIVEAQTKVELAKQNLAEADIARQAAEKQALTIKVLADAEAYKKRTAQQANNSLEARLENNLKIQQAWAEAFSKHPGPLVPSTVMGGSNGTFNPAQAFMNMATVDYAKRIMGGQKAE